MTTPRTVFLSSTGKDLAHHRQAVYAAIQGMEGYQCVRQEDFGSRSQDADAFCREQVARCDVFVGLIGHFYGSTPPGTRQSFTEREYLAAVAAGKPCLMFMATDDFPLLAGLIERDSRRVRQRAFRRRIEQHHIRDQFATPDGLAT